MARQQHRAARVFLLAAMAVMLGPGAFVHQAAAARALTQEAGAPAPAPADATVAAVDPAPAPADNSGLGPVPESQYGSPEVDYCIQLTNTAGQACTVESDTLSLVYSRGSEELPTQDQITEAISDMKAAAQPSTDCCQKLLPYADARCPCDPGYQQLLPIGGFDPAYFEGATAILAIACGSSFPTCVPGEVSKPSGR